LSPEQVRQQNAALLLQAERFRVQEDEVSVEAE
jgi:hypothetical protein